MVRIHHVVEKQHSRGKVPSRTARPPSLTPHLPPDRRQHGQSVLEAVAMLVNAGLHGEDAELFGSTRQMEYFSGAGSGALSARANLANPCPSISKVRKPMPDTS